MGSAAVEARDRRARHMTTAVRFEVFAGERISTLICRAAGRSRVVSKVIEKRSCEGENPLLRVHAKNHRYLDNGSGKPLYLVSSHTWMTDWNLQKWLDYLRFCRHWGLNFVRMWSWEHNRGDIGIWVRESDGRSNLDKLDQKYFDSLRIRPEADRQGCSKARCFRIQWALPNHDLNLRTDCIR